MTTSAPVRREYDVPIVEPYRTPAEPLRLPEPDPRRVVFPTIVFPVRKPVEVSHELSV